MKSRRKVMARVLLPNRWQLSELAAAYRGASATPDHFGKCSVLVARELSKRPQTAGAMNGSIIQTQSAWTHWSPSGVGLSKGSISSMPDSGGSHRERQCGWIPSSGGFCKRLGKPLKIPGHHLPSCGARKSVCSLELPEMTSAAFSFPITRSSMPTPTVAARSA